MKTTKTTRPFKGVEKEMDAVKELIGHKWPQNCWLGLCEVVKLIDDQLKKQDDPEEAASYRGYFDSLHEGKVALLMACDAIKMSMEERLEEEILRCEDYIEQLNELKDQNDSEETSKIDEAMEFLGYLLSDTVKLSVAENKRLWEETCRNELIEPIWRFVMSELWSYKYSMKDILMMPCHVYNFSKIKPVFEAHWDEVQDSPDLKGKEYYINVTTMEIMEMTDGE